SGWLARPADPGPPRRPRGRRPGLPPVRRDAGLRRLLPQLPCRRPPDDGEHRRPRPGLGPDALGGHGARPAPAARPAGIRDPPAPGSRDASADAATRRERLWRLADDRGIVAGIAIDHRDSLRALLEQGGLGDLTTAEIRELKLRLTSALAPSATAIMLD